MATASSSVSKGIIASTGPKTSSQYSCVSSGTLSTMVGPTQLPFAVPSTSELNPRPSSTTLAPLPPRR